MEVLIRSQGVSFNIAKYVYLINKDNGNDLDIIFYVYILNKNHGFLQ